MERDVQTVQQQFRKFLALEPHLSLARANKAIPHWLMNEYGQREHDTTYREPYPTFLEQEKPALKDLPEATFESARWKQAKVHPD